MKRAAEDSPHRCQASNSHGQCSLEALEFDGEYTTNCQVHGGAGQLRALKNASLDNYRVAKWKSRILEKRDSPKIKSLREEIGIIRILLDETLRGCHTPHELLLQSHAISDLVGKIEKVVTSCHKLEGSMGLHLDKQAILQFANEIITIIAEEAEPETLDRIASKILQKVGEHGSTD